MWPQIFGQDADILAGRAGTTAGTVRERRRLISWVAWVLISLEECMEERQHHLNESSSARLGRSQKLESLPTNSKSLGAYFLMSAYIFCMRRDFNLRLVTVVYYVAHII